ncbi:hypothetical protein OU995_12260 [Roseateles sp. SL47]|uniref:hypothetical protein n=1 Tax=Roseateles sp. SL47 TaxID=2995138 RepID=UPI00227093B7|nr:hypothetical protein [Roseateles sp. SL47]WAC75420.1 hypothetical protein OU995_12260 [Roseateles sp. SL47]
MHLHLCSAVFVVPRGADLYVEPAGHRLAPSEQIFEPDIDRSRDDRPSRSGTPQTAPRAPHLQDPPPPYADAFHGHAGGDLAGVRRADPWLHGEAWPAPLYAAAVVDREWSRLDTDQAHRPVDPVPLLKYLEAFGELLQASEGLQDLAGRSEQLLHPKVVSAVAALSEPAWARGGTASTQGSEGLRLRDDLLIHYCEVVAELVKRHHLEGDRVFDRLSSCEDGCPLLLRWAELARSDERAGVALGTLMEGLVASSRQRDPQKYYRGKLRELEFTEPGTTDKYRSFWCRLIRDGNLTYDHLGTAQVIYRAALQDLWPSPFKVFRTQSPARASKYINAASASKGYWSQQPERIRPAGLPLGIAGKQLATAASVLLAPTLGTGMPSDTLAALQSRAPVRGT